MMSRMIFLSQLEQRDLGLTQRRATGMPFSELQGVAENAFSQKFADALDRPDCFEPPKFGPLPGYERQLNRLYDLSLRLADVAIISEMEKEFSRI